MRSLSISRGHADEIHAVNEEHFLDQECSVSAEACITGLYSVLPCREKAKNDPVLDHDELAMMRCRPFLPVVFKDLDFQLQSHVSLSANPPDPGGHSPLQIRPQGVLVHDDRRRVRPVHRRDNVFDAIDERLGPRWKPFDRGGADERHAHADRIGRHDVERLGKRDLETNIHLRDEFEEVLVRHPLVQIQSLAGRGEHSLDVLQVVRPTLLDPHPVHVEREPLPVRLRKPDGSESLH